MTEYGSRYGKGGGEQSWQRPPTREGDELLADYASKALEAFQRDCEKDYAALIETYEGYAAAVGVFGVGSVTVAVIDGNAVVNPDPERCPVVKARGATYPEIISAMAHGELTALDAFHRGEIVIQTEDSDELHRAYDFYARFSGDVLASKRLTELFSDFQDALR